MASLNHAGVTVTDLEASRAFYVDVVGMELVLPGFQTGGEWFDTLTENSGCGHRCGTVVRRGNDLAVGAVPRGGDR